MRSPRDGGQATVELVAMAPIVVLCGLLALQALVAGASFVNVQNAAHAGALAGALGDDPARAARQALPGWSSGRVTASTRGHRIDVRLRPRAIVPPLASLLEVRAHARFTAP
jgi:pilus assembly protein CpaE